MAGTHLAEEIHTHLAEETDCIGHDLLIMHISNFNNDGSC